MRIIGSSTHFLLLVLALASGFAAAITAGYSIKDWRTKTIAVVVQPKIKEVPKNYIVVAAEPLRYGTELTKDNLKRIEWPLEAVPRGAVADISDLLNRKGKPVALSFMEIGEPVLKRKITGPGQRASLSAMLSEQTKAVSIRVNAVLGVGGFVLPGDHVDILLTREEAVEVGARIVSRTYTDVLLQNIRILAIDQIADDKKDKPSLAKTVTVEVRINDAQKLVLASTVGVLSLTLRRAGDMLTENTKRTTMADLSFGQSVEPIKKDSGSRSALVSVTRAVEKSEYHVHRE